MFVEKKIIKFLWHNKKNDEDIKIVKEYKF